MRFGIWVYVVTHFVSLTGYEAWVRFRIRVPVPMRDSAILKQKNFVYIWIETNILSTLLNISWQISYFLKSIF